jgi:hypothetical protein
MQSDREDGDMATRAHTMSASHGLQSPSTGRRFRWGRLAFLLVNCALWGGLIVFSRALH